MPSYKLIYFNSRGGAELARLVFAAAGKEYEDMRIPREEWPNKKADQPLKALPVLEVDGKKFCQGMAIARYLAREFGLMGKTNLDAFRIDELCEAISELFQSFIKVFHEQDEKRKEDLKKTLNDETLPKFSAFLEMRLKENDGGKGFVVGNELSLADLLVYNSMSMIRGLQQRFGLTDPFEKFESLNAHFTRIDAVQNIAEWVKKRPVTDM